MTKVQPLTGIEKELWQAADILPQYKIPLVSIKILSNFNRVVTSFFEKIKKNSVESSYLEGCRDILLPKTLSGEIAVSKIKTKGKL